MSLFLVLDVPPAISHKAQPGEAVLPKYDLYLEKESEGEAEEVNLLPLGTRKDFSELIIKRGDDQLHVYVCPKPTQEEMGISCSKKDEVAVTGAKVEQDASDVIPARELVKSADTLSFRYGKGNPAWDLHTGKLDKIKGV